MKQRILIVGADNLLGRRLISALSQTSWAAPVAMEHTAVSEFANAGAIVSCVIGRPQTITASAQWLFNAIKTAPNAPRVILISSMTVYGTATGLIDERSPMRDDLGAYATARVAAELLAAQYPHVVTLRPGCEYGPNCPDWSERIAKWLVARRIGDLGARGDGLCNLIYIDDLITATLSALRTPGIEGQAFNLANSELLTWNDYFTRFAKALSAVPLVRPSPRRLKLESKLLAPPLKILELALGSKLARALKIPSPIPPSFLRNCSHEIKLDVSAAEKTLGLKWTPVDEALQNTAKWLSRT
jgi:2-alkyl-3-oxoalkanoate reductase